MTTGWQAWGRGARAAAVAAGPAALLVVAAFTWWLWRPEPAVLFADLSPQDAALMASELDKLKVPYSVGAGGGSLLVDKAVVHATRLKLMGKDLPLHGAVGFELFNTADFGMTEFAQKINFQRALQGELTRTILSFPEVRQARVHLALPEQGLFKPASATPKAGVTLALRQGQAMRPEQVAGIQRLLAAAVPGLAAHQVTIVDDHGVALSRAAPSEGQAVQGAQLDLKREVEGYLSRKAGIVLERALGPGQALATVDATLDMDQVRTTTEDVLPAADARGSVAGVLVRERESTRDSGVADPRAEARAVRGSSMQCDADYQAGRRVEQVVSQPGSVRRLHVVAVVRQTLTLAQQEQLRQMVGAAVGVSAERGDTVLVQAFTPPASVEARAVEPASSTGDSAVEVRPAGQVPMAWGVAGGLVVCLLAAAGLVLHRRWVPLSMPVARLTEPQRQLALGQVRAWLDGAEPRPAMTPGPRRDA